MWQWVTAEERIAAAGTAQLPRGGFGASGLKGFRAHWRRENLNSIYVNLGANLQQQKTLGVKVPLLITKVLGN